MRPKFPVRRRGAIVAAFLWTAAVGVVFGQSRDSEDWASSPEAYFLTKGERAEWKALDSRDSRQRFIEQYWLKRDPSPGSERNEFKELVLGRIKIANERFRIEKTPGSRTARGLVFIVLGTPARVSDRNAPPPPPDPGASRRAGQPLPSVGLVEGNETTSTWFYDPDRTPRILEVLGRPSLQLVIVVEPSRHMDSIQDPGLFHEINEIVANKSIVNPDLVPPSAGGAAGPRSPLPALPREPLTAAMRQVLGSAPGVFRSDGAFVGSAVIFHERGNPESLFWIFTPASSRRPFFHALVKAADGTEVTTVSQPAAVSASFSTRGPGLVALLRLALPPGSYSASVALTEENGKVLAAAALPVQVPALEKEFAVSSILVTRGPAPVGPKTDPAFSFAGTSLPPRADASFAPSESLWYFVEIANPSDPARVLLEARVRRGAEPMGGLPPFAARVQPIGSGRYFTGVELPLATLAPGDYVLYLTVRDGEGEGRSQVLRRADFQVAR